MLNKILRFNIKFCIYIGSLDFYAVNWKNVSNFYYKFSSGKVIYFFIKKFYFRFLRLFENCIILMCFLDKIKERFNLLLN